jgi:tetratricopeptide (TPR) repeat protein
VPVERIAIELYPNHDDFAVRTAGLPGIGLLGVTFGHVVAMDSPSGRKAGDFHWGSTLWHEMAHVFTLSATQHRVPRWLSEGLSVFEEWRTGPTPGVSITPDVLDAFAAKKFLPIANLDSGFLRPAYEGQIQVSYQQAGLICLFAEQVWGFDRLVRFLQAFRSDVSTADAVKQVFDISPEEFDTRFAAFLQQHFQNYLAAPKKWATLAGQANTALEKKDWAVARDAAKVAMALLPEFTGGGSAYEALANAEENLGNRAAAIAALQAWRRAGGWHPDGLRKLAQLLLGAGRNAEAREVLEAVNYADPLAVTGHGELGELLLDANQNADARREFEVLLVLQPQDTALANFGLARVYQQSGDAVQARLHLLESLDTAPHYRPAQKMLLELGDRP